MSAAFWFMVAVTSTAFLTFLSFVIWLDGRQKEREAHYRNELAQKLADAGDSGPVMEYIKSLERADAARAQMKSRVSGLVTLATGLALTLFLHQIAPGVPVYLAGLIPVFIGVVLLVMSEWIMRPKD